MIRKEKTNDASKASLMKRIFPVIFFCLLIASPLCAWSGKCFGVTDGDTIKVLHDGTETRIRLYGIDCPEKKQDFSRRAKEFTLTLVMNKVVEVEPITIDRYGRTVAWVSVEGKSLNKEILKSGLAWWYTKYAPNDEDLRTLEEDARHRKVGLWAHPNPQPPWQFRKSTRKR